MIYGTGIDLVKISRIEGVLERWGARFVNRVFTPDEARICYSRAKPPAAFAIRFAAKEAFSKALGLGMRKGVKWRDIEVFNHKSGKPGFKLHGTSFDICRKEGIVSFHLSLSDEGDYGAATVVLEKTMDV
jgi:holo-[acyl-carrier protein] synthase